MGKLPRKRVRALPEWDRLSDDEILDWRIRDLGLDLKTSPLVDCVDRLYEELAARNLVFRPPCYLADEWLCPDREPIIGIPFYLAHPRLRRIEQRLMYEVEGGTVASCMQLLRHEAGHAMNYAYRLYRRTRWRELFGTFSSPYSDNYSFQPYSKRYVVHLPDNYAQSHPDEDFAETFAVWLTPGDEWATRYRDWPALRKLEYVDHLMKDVAGRPPRVVASETPWSAQRMTSTLRAFYNRRRRYMKDAFPGYYDGVLTQIFAVRESAPPDERASRFLRKHRRHIMDSVALWTSVMKYDIHQFLTKLIQRCDALDLALQHSGEDTLIDVASLVAAVCGNSFKLDLRGERHR